MNSQRSPDNRFVNHIDDRYKMLNLLVILFGFLMHVSAHATAEVVGEAFDLDSDRLLYREQHSYSHDGLSHSVQYFDPKGRLMVDKVLDYRTGLTTPEFVQRDYQNDQEISVHWSDSALTLTWIANAKPVIKKLEPKEPMVIDAGFDRFIKKNWTRLIQGRVFRFYYPSPVHSRMFELQIERSKCSDDFATEQCFKMQMSNWFSRMLVAPIELGYSMQNKRLVRYRGLSNIKDAKGGALVVDIRYKYRSEETGD